MTNRARTYNVLNILMKFHAFPDEVDGKYCLVECTVPPGAGAPPTITQAKRKGFSCLAGRSDS